MSKTPRPYLVFYGTLTTIVRAQTADAAFRSFVSSQFPEHGKQGRIVPPTRSEVTIRRPTEADRAWIEDTRDKVFISLLSELAS